MFTSMERGRMISLEESYRQCMVLTQSHYENFPVASVLLPARTRPAISVIYAFARVADDYSDEVEDARESMDLLAGWRALLYQSSREPVDHYVFRALHDVIVRYELPVEWLDHLIMAFERDRQVVRHPTFSDLIVYSRLSANPVGRLLLWIHGYREERLLLWSDAICTALQLANFWQDIGIDREKGRIYVPTSEIVAAGLTEESLYAGTDERHERLKRRLRSYTLGLFAAGRELPGSLSGRLSLEIALVLAGGLEILEQATRVGRPLAERPALSRMDWVKTGTKVLTRLWRFPEPSDPSDALFQEGFSACSVLPERSGKDRKASSMIRS
ncbi:MAG: squalene/phytoene synthase family protein [Leptospirales bacterium]